MAATGRETSAFVADGEAVWFWRPEAGVKFARTPKASRGRRGQQSGGPRGERGRNRKTIAWGMPDDSGASAVNTGVHTTTNMRTPGCGCIGHPAFPAPSFDEGDEISDQSRARIAPRDRDVLV